MLSNVLINALRFNFSRAVKEHMQSVSELALL